MAFGGSDSAAPEASSTSTFREKAFQQIFPYASEVASLTHHLRNSDQHKRDQEIVHL